MGKGIFSRLFGKRTRAERPRYHDYRDEYVDEEPLEPESENLLIDHRFVYEPEDEYDMHIGEMIYQVKVENTTDYPLGNLRAAFGKGYKLGKFGDVELENRMVDPGDTAVVTVPFTPTYEYGSEEFEVQMKFFDFRYKVEEKITLSTESLKVSVPKLRPMTMDETGYRLLTSDLYRWSLETDLLDLSPDELYGLIVGRLKRIGLREANELLNESLFRGISQYVATDKRGRKWASQVQVIGKGREAKLLLYTFGEKPQMAINLTAKLLQDEALRGIVLHNKIAKPASKPKKKPEIVKKRVVKPRRKKRVIVGKGDDGSGGWE